MHLAPVEHHRGQALGTCTEGDRADDACPGIPMLATSRAFCKRVVHEQKVTACLPLRSARPLVRQRPACKRTRAGQGAEGLLAEEAQEATGTPSRGAFPPEDLGELPGCDVHAESGRVLNRERKNGRRS